MTTRDINTSVVNRPENWTENEEEAFQQMEQEQTNMTNSETHSLITSLKALSDTLVPLQRNINQFLALFTQQQQLERTLQSELKDRELSLTQPVDTQHPVVNPAPRIYQVGVLDRSAGEVTSTVTTPTDVAEQYQPHGPSDEEVANPETMSPVAMTTMSNMNDVEIVEDVQDNAEAMLHAKILGMVKQLITFDPTPMDKISSEENSRVLSGIAQTAKVLNIVQEMFHDRPSVEVQVVIQFLNEIGYISLFNYELKHLGEANESDIPPLYVQHMQRSIHTEAYNLQRRLTTTCIPLQEAMNNLYQHQASWICNLLDVKADGISDLNASQFAHLMISRLLQTIENQRRTEMGSILATTRGHQVDIPKGTVHTSTEEVQAVMNQLTTQMNPVVESVEDRLKSTLSTNFQNLVVNAFSGEISNRFQGIWKPGFQGMKHYREDAMTVNSERLIRYYPEGFYTNCQSGDLQCLVKLPSEVMVMIALKKEPEECMWFIVHNPHGCEPEVILEQLRYRLLGAETITD